MIVLLIAVVALPLIVVGFVAAVCIAVAVRVAVVCAIGLGKLTAALLPRPRG